MSDLLTEEERDSCTPTTEQLEQYMAMPDDRVASEIRNSLPDMFREICRAILYGQNIAKAQREKTLRAVGKWLESCKVERDTPSIKYWITSSEITDFLSGHLP